MKEKISKKVFQQGLLFVFLACIIIKAINEYEQVFRVLNSLANIIWPFVLGAIFAYILNPLVKLLEKLLKGRRGLSVVLSFVIAILLLSLMGALVTPVIIQNITDLVRHIPG